MIITRQAHKKALLINTLCVIQQYCSVVELGISRTRQTIAQLYNAGDVDMYSPKAGN